MDGIHTEEHQLHSMLLFRSDQLVFEEYFNGYDVNRPHDLRSVTKSISAILLGIAIDQGFIESVNDPISKYLDFSEENKNFDPRKTQITIKHLITMSSGLDCNDWDKRSKGQEDKVYKKKDLITYTMNLPLINDPGSQSYYCTMGVVLTKEIIQRASGMPLDVFAKKYLFEPLGIRDYSWGYTADNREVIPAAKRLYMKPRDLAKIGLLVKNKGKWNKKSIVPESWIRELATPQTKITGLAYGYLWWKFPLGSAAKSYEALVATGNGGQYIIIIEELDFIAIFTGGAYNSEKDKLPFSIVNQVLIPSLHQSQ